MAQTHDEVVQAFDHGALTASGRFIRVKEISRGTILYVTDTDPDTAEIVYAFRDRITGKQFLFDIETPAHRALVRENITRREYTLLRGVRPRVDAFEEDVHLYIPGLQADITGLVTHWLQSQMAQ